MTWSQPLVIANELPKRRTRWQRLILTQRPLLGFGVVLHDGRADDLDDGDDDLLQAAVDGLADIDRGSECGRSSHDKEGSREGRQNEAFHRSPLI